MTIRSDLGQEFLNHLKAVFGMRHFASPEFEGDFDFHVLAQEINSMLNFDAKIVRIDFWAELDFFNFVGVLMLLGFLVALGLFVAKLPVIHEAADGRIGIGGDFDQVNGISPGEVQGVAQTQDAELFAINPNDSYFAGADFPIYPDEQTGRRRRTWRKRATQDTLDG